MCFRPNQARSKERNALLKDIERGGGPLAGLPHRGVIFWMGEGLRLFVAQVEARIGRNTA